MKNTFGTSIQLTLFGESHGEAIGAVLDGLAPGLPVDETEIARQLARRRPASALDTARREPDPFRLVSGVCHGYTTGAPLCLLIPNQDTRSGDYELLRDLARPSHADYAARCKYHGFEDYRGGGHFSGRITAALVAAGAILRGAAARLGITVGTHILRCGGAADRPFADDPTADIALLDTADFPVLDAACREPIEAAILAARASSDSIGGVIQTAVAGLPAGVGEPWFDSVEGQLSRALFAVGGIKGVSFGAGFAGTEMPGSVFNDALRSENGRIVTRTNHNGGINGGITNGMPVVFDCAVKPTPSLSRPQDTVSLSTGENATLTVHGRHDPAIIRRICPVVDSVTLLALCDLLAQRYGTDVFVRQETASGTHHAPSDRTDSSVPSAK